MARANRGHFEVMAERCAECLFGRNPIVDDERRREIIVGLARDDLHFVCHLSSIARAGEATVCCRGDWDRDSSRTNLMRIAQRLGVVRFLREDEL